MKGRLIAFTAFCLFGCGENGSGLARAEGVFGGEQRGVLEINAAMGLEWIDRPWPNESNVGGAVLLQRKDRGPVEAAVEVNGVAFVEDPSLLGFFAAGQARVPDTAGRVLSIRARSGEGIERLDLPCPAEVIVVSPARGSTVRRGESIEVKWLGDVHPNSLGFILKPTIGFHVLQVPSGRWVRVEGGGPVPRGEQRIQTTIPDVSGDQIVLELSVPGEFVSIPNRSGGEHTGLCWLKRRVELKLVD